MSPLLGKQRSDTKVFILLLGVINISTAAIFIRMAMAEASPMAIAALRMAISALPLLPVAIWKYRRDLQGISKRDWGLSLLSGFLLAFHFATWITSLGYTSIASSVVLVCTTPIWVTVLGMLFTHEKVIPRMAVGILLAFAGGSLVAASEVCSLATTGIHCSLQQGAASRQANLGNLLALLGAWMAAGYLFIGRQVRPRLALVPYTAIVYTTSACALLFLVLLRNVPLSPFSPRVYLWIGLMAVFPQLIGHSALNWALRHLPTTYVAIAQMGEPVGSTLLAMFLFQEIPSVIKVGGSLLILAGIFTATTAAQALQEPS